MTKTWTLQLEKTVIKQALPICSWKKKKLCLSNSCQQTAFDLTRIYYFCTWEVPVTYFEGESTVPPSLTLPLSSSKTKWSSGCMKLWGLTRGTADLCTLHSSLKNQTPLQRTISFSLSTKKDINDNVMKFIINNQIPP